MISFSLRFIRPAAVAATALLLAACTTPPPPAAPTAGISDDLRTLAYDGSKAPVKALAADIAAAGLDPVKLTALARPLTAALADSTVTFAGRQAIAEQLGKLPAESVLTAGTRPQFAAMLLDDNQVNLALLALEQQPGAAVDRLFVETLGLAKTRLTRMAAAQAAGNRRIEAAVGPLATLLRDRDPATVAAATTALGQIGTSASLRALRNAPDPASTENVAARIHAASRLGGPDAAKALQSVRDDLELPAALRASALRALCIADPAHAPERIVAALRKGDEPDRAVLVESIADFPSADLVPALGAAMPAFSPATQVSVLAALGRRGDSAAVPFVSRFAGEADADVRAAAIGTLGLLPGSPETAMLLARIAAGGDAADARIARASLARITGPGVAETITRNAAQGETPLRVVFIEQLALRYMTETADLLLGFRQDSIPEVRIAALNALAEVAPGVAQGAVLDWTIAAPETAEQGRGLRALASVSSRIPDPVARAQTVAHAIERAEPAVIVRLLPVLGRIGGAAAAESAARLALREDPAVASAAIAVLARWQDASALTALVSVAERAAADSIRAAALQSATRLIDRSRALPSSEITTAVSRLLATSNDESARRRLVFLLGRASDDDALAMADRLQAEAALKVEAADASLAIQSRRAGAPVIETSANQWQRNTIVDGLYLPNWVAAATAGQWIQLDFHSVRPFRQLVLDASGRPDDAPAHFQIFVTDDPQQPGEVRASGNGQRDRTVIDLPPGTRGRYLIVRNTETRPDGWWAVSELLVD